MDGTIKEKQFIIDTIQKADQLGLNVFVCTNHECGINNPENMINIQETYQKYLETRKYKDGGPTFKDLLDRLRLLVLDNEGVIYLFEGRDNDVVYPKWIVQCKDFGSDWLNYIFYYKKDRSTSPEPLLKISFSEYMNRTDHNLYIGNAFITPLHQQNLYDKYKMSIPAYLSIDSYCWEIFEEDQIPIKEIIKKI